MDVTDRQCRRELQGGDNSDDAWKDMSDATMDRWSVDDPCKRVDQLATSIRPRLWINLLVRDVNAAIGFQVNVLGARNIYAD